MTYAAFLRTGGEESDVSRMVRPARPLPSRLVVRRLAALSLFALGPALFAPAGAWAQGDEAETKADEDDEQEEAEAHEQPGAPKVDRPAQPVAAPQEQPVQPPPFEAPRPFEQEIAATEPVQMPEPYQLPPDPYDTAADTSQIDWPQDVAAEEAAVDSYDDGYDPQAHTQFQEELAPYGDWIDDASYGRVWTPNVSLVGTDFTPYYTGGHWALTEFGWTWISDWSWGWAPFHYGRWIVLASHGWCWVPGTMWGPAWVTWRTGGGWVGWAALPPRGVSVTTTYGRRSPWRFTRAVDLGARRIRSVQRDQMKDMFRRTTTVANDRVLTRGNATVHINAGPRYIPNATPTRLKTLAPHTFPQRTILPRPGAKMGARPWIRAARAAATPDRGAGPLGGGAAGGGGRVSGGAFAGHGAARPSLPPHVYNPGPQRLSGVPAAPHTFTPPVSAGNAPFTNTAPRVYDPPPATARRIFDTPAAGSARPVYTPPPANTVPRIYNPPPASGVGRQTFNPPSTFGPPRAVTTPPTFTTPRTFGTAPAFATPRTFGSLPANNPAQVYNPPPRAFTTPPAVNPTRSFGSAAAPVFNPPARSFSAPPAQHAPALHQGFSRPQMHAAPPQRSFTPPAGGGFGRPGGGAQFGGHRR
jgi:hypothetical protein